MENNPYAPTATPVEPRNDTPEPVVAMADSPQAPTQAAPASDGQRAFDMFVAAAQAGALRSFSFETVGGIRCGWSQPVVAAQAPGQ